MRVRLTLPVVKLILLTWSLFPGSLSAEPTTSDRGIQIYQWMIRRNPGDARAYYRLGDAYIQKARVTGDVGYLDLAEKALGKALDIYPHYGDASRHLAFVLYSRHDFSGAAVEAKKAISLNPSDSHAYGVLGDAYLEVGKYDLAKEAYQKMAQLGEDLYSLSRRSGLKNLEGDPEGAIEDLREAIEVGRARGLPKESIAWAQWQLGSEQFARGDLKAAEAAYADSLKTYPNYHRALAGLAQVRAAQQDYPQAIDLYKRAIAVIPLPEYAAALGDVYGKLDRPEEAKKQYDLVEYIGYLNSLNKVLYNRELAYFYADHEMKLPQGLELAERELEVRQDIYAYDAYAWALYRNGRMRQAREPMKKALAMGTKDAKLFFHAGMIERGLGHTAEARAYLQRALDTNPHFHLLHADIARRALAELGSQRNASQ